MLRIPERQRQSPRRSFLPLLATGAFLVGLAGSATAQEIKLNPSSVQFGRVTDAKTRTVKIQNKGRADLVIGPIARCAGTTDEFSFSPTDTVVAARRNTDLRVTYAPTDSGDDRGCLEIPSNDPSNPVVTLRLAGSGARPEGGQLRLRPESLDFGQVLIGTSAARSSQVQTSGGATVEVAVALCEGTSAEFSVSPTQLTVAPGRGTSMEVTYLPVDTGSDEGCVELQRLDGVEGPLPLSLAGTGTEQEQPDAVLDLDIHDFKVKKESRLNAPQEIKIRLWVKNEGEESAPAPATVVGTQNAMIVYEDALLVADRPGNEGVSKFTFPAFTPTQIGDIVWTVTIEDTDPDVDTATAVTRVVGEAEEGATGVDLDIRRFRVTQAVSLATDKAIQLRLAVQNNGDLDETRDATLVGMQNEVEVFSQTLAVADAPGNRGATTYRFSQFFPASAGEIIWMVVLDDDDEDLDEAFAVTRVLP